MGLEYLQILISLAGPGINPPWIYQGTKGQLYFQNNICIKNDFSILQCDILARNENISIVDAL